MPKVRLKISGIAEQQGLPGTDVKTEKWERENVSSGESYTEVRIAAEAIAKIRPSNHHLQVQKADKDGNWITKWECDGKADEKPGRPSKPEDPDKPKKDKAVRNEKKEKMRVVK
jgi:hypothetical protein